MTELYNRNEVNSRHLVAFSKPKSDGELYYYDFNVQVWRQVVPLDNLPYNLCSYRFVDDTDERCVVTCHDSYRLSTDPKKEPNSQVLEFERKWREDIVKDGAEMEYTNRGGETRRAKVLWCKADIVPGVVVCGPRECPNINGFGYIYKESRRFTKTGTHLPIITQEQLAQEKREKEKASKMYAEFQDKLWGIKNTLPYITCKGWVCGVYDTRTWWKESVRKYQEPITEQLLRDWLIENDKNDAIEILDEGISLTKLCIYAEVTFAKEYDACFVNTERLVQQEWKPDPNVQYTSQEAEDRARKKWEPVEILGTGFQFIFDIKVHDASYAYMECGDQRCHFDMLKVGDVWTFPDITYDNPLHQAVSGSVYRFYTDGTKITYSAGWKYTDTNRLMVNIGNNWAVSELQNHILLNGHMWSASMSWPITDTNIENNKKPTRKETEDKERQSAQWVQMS